MPDATVPVAVVAIVTVAIGLLSYFGLTKKPHEIDPSETRASRALFDAWEVAILIGSINVATFIAEARHASFLGKLLAIALGGLGGGLILAAFRRPVARLLAVALRQR